MNPTQDSINQSPPGLQSPLDPPVDPVIAALLAAGSPVQLPPQQTPPAPGPQIVGPPPAPMDPYAVPADPYAAPAPKAKPQGQPVKSGDVNAATAEQNASLESATRRVENAELAKTDALSAHAQARAQIYEGHATAQGLMDQQYQQARASARKDAEAETAVWMRDLDKKVAEEPQPGRWFSNLSSFGKIMYVASLAFGALAQSKNANLKNIGLEMIIQEMNSDMAEQRDKLKRQVEVMKVKGEKIDRKLAERIADSRDDHTMMASRLAIIQQSAMERANAPGPADQKAAMAEAAQWAGQERLKIAGERANRAYVEREGQLNREAENARAYLTDKRTRDIAAAEIQKDYDLARINAGVKLSAKEDQRLKDSVVLNPDATGIRVVGPDGKPVATPLHAGGGLVVSKGDVEKQARQDAAMAQDRYSLLRRVSDELSKDEDITVLLRRNPQLVSDLQKLGYQQARENDPRGIVTDKDLISGMESALGGDLSSLSGRIAAGTFSAGQGKLKEVVDKAIRDMPAKVSNKLGALIDAAVPGYEGNVRVDWTPKSVEIAEPGSQSTQQIDASYGIKTPIPAPQTIGDLENAQALEKKGVQSLPPYRPGSQDKVLKALEDFKGAMPRTIMDRAGKVQSQLDEAGDTRASLEVQQAQIREMYKANDRLADIDEVLHDISHPKPSGPGGVGQTYGGEGGKIVSDMSAPERRALDRNEIPIHSVIDVAKAHGITQLTGQDVLDIIKKAGLKPYKE